MIRIGSALEELRPWVRKAFASVTIMVIPHGDFKSLNIHIPVAALFILILLATTGGGYILCLALSGLEYKAQNQAMAEKIRFYSEQFYQWDSTLAGLKAAETRFRKIFSFKTREDVLQYVDASTVSSIDIPDLAVDMKRTVFAAGQIKEYLRNQKSLYLSTPMGYPAAGNISSSFGARSDPINGEDAYHLGIDVSCSRGTPIRATADGVVRHSGWLQGRGFAVVLEHGCGYSTIYAHNEINTVRLGGQVKRGDIIGYVGSSGRSTGPHVHYEIWKNGKPVNPLHYFTRRS